MNIQNAKPGTRNAQRQRGVTLIEMATVVTIVLILGAMIIVEYNNMDDKARRNPALVSAKAIADGLRMYQADRGNQGYTCVMDRLALYVNLTSLKSSFTSVEIKTDDCTDFDPLNYLYITGTVKGIQPSYIVNYYIEKPAITGPPPEGSTCDDSICCSNGGVSPYPCKSKF